ncbi:hypothetical protein C0584_02505 [Candidatus Parcubacteria bacterium]|nr:MAG: hypothetical protein C0584_02505 [Candidatus Parcubacteria bacterium]
MKTIIGYILIITLFTLNSFSALAADLYITKVEPHIYTKISSGDPEEAPSGGAVKGGVGGGLLGGWLLGPVGLISGAIIGSKAGSDSDKKKQREIESPKETRVNGYKVQLSNGQTILTPFKYTEGQVIDYQSLVVDIVLK